VELMSRRTLLYRSQYYPEVKFLNCKIGRAKACLGTGDSRYIIDGTMTLNYVESKKWGREIHIQVFSDECIVQKRSGEKKWSRIEIFFPVTDLDRLISELQFIQNFVRRKS